jgi:hypothetical protein
MDPLAFTVRSDALQGEGPLLAPCPPCDIAEDMWVDLAAHIALERLIPYPADILAGRWREGYAAATVCAGRIISYISLAPIMLGSEGVHTWRKITAQRFVDPAGLPGTNVYEFTTSWTDPEWRRRRISIGMRGPLVERFLEGDALGMAAMIGLSSRIPAKLGWQLFPTDAAPFASSLVFIPSRDFPGLAAMGWQLPEELELYQGPQIPLDDPAHPWDRYVYWWVSSREVTVRLDRELAVLFNGDLACWRSAIVTEFATPGSPHRLSFFGERK